MMNVGCSMIIIDCLIVTDSEKGGEDGWVVV